jgi:hypothetical protein
VEEKEIARKRLRLLLALWDLGIGVYAVFWAKDFQQIFLFAPRIEPLFIRGVRLYWLKDESQVDWNLTDK